MIERKCEEYGHNPEALQRAFKEWQEWDKAKYVAHISRRKESKTAPHVSQVGSQATDMPDLDSMSRSDRVKFMTERYQQSQQ